MPPNRRSTTGAVLLRAAGAAPRWRPSDRELLDICARNSILSHCEVIRTNEVSGAFGRSPADIRQIDAAASKIKVRGARLPEAMLRMTGL